LDIEIWDDNFIKLEIIELSDTSDKVDEGGVILNPIMT
jgi:hypothetical protein